MGDVKIISHAAAYRLKIGSLAVRNAGRAAAFAAGKSRGLLRKGGQVGKGSSRHTVHSAPGQPPFTQSGRLKGSVTSQVIRDGSTVVGRYGSNVEYARRLEKGFFGEVTQVRKGKGGFGSRMVTQHVQQKPRPYLRPVLKMFKKELVAILFGRK